MQTDFPASHGCQTLEEQCAGHGATCTEAQRAALLDWLQVRNYSILAHGFTPIARDDWVRGADLLDSSFIPMLREELALAGLKTPFEQLPGRSLWE